MHVFHSIDLLLFISRRLLRHRATLARIFRRPVADQDVGQRITFNRLSFKLEIERVPLIAIRTIELHRVHSSFYSVSFSVNEAWSIDVVRVRVQCSIVRWRFDQDFFRRYNGKLTEKSIENCFRFFRKSSDYPRYNQRLFPLQIQTTFSNNDLPSS